MKKCALITAAFVCAVPQLTFALEVDREVMPRIALGGRVVTSNYYLQRGPDKSQLAGIRLDDSSLLLAFDKRLYSNSVGSATIGIKDTHDGLMMHQLYAGLWSRHFKVTLGRTNLRNTLIEFPTLRDDDLLDYTHVLNGETGAHLDDDHQIAIDDENAQLYGNTVALDWFVGGRDHSVGIWSSERSGHGDFNTVGMAYGYEPSEDLRYVSRIRHLGVILDMQNVAHNDKWVYGLIGGTEININRNPSNNAALALQMIRVWGTTTDNGFDSFSAKAIQSSISLVSALKYTHRPLLLTRWVASFQMAYKVYDDYADTYQWSVAPHFVYQLGQGVSINTQVLYSRYEGLSPYDWDVTAQIGISMSLDAVFNDTIGERNSILNLEHGYNL